MTRLLVNRLADRDAEEIFETIRQSGGSKAAASFEERLDALLMRLSEFPEAARHARTLDPTFESA